MEKKPVRLDEVQEAFGRLVTTLDIRASRELIDQAPPESQAPLRAVYGHLGPLLIEHYQDLVRGAWWGALDKCYAITADVLGEQAWRALCEAYLRDCPPNDWDINSLSLHLPEYIRNTWLKRHPELPPFLAELADYERIELEVFLCEEAPEDLPLPSLRAPKVNETLQIQRFSRDIASWVKNREDDTLSDKPADPEHKETFTAFYRHPETLTCRFLNVTPLTAFALQGWREGRRSETIARALAETLRDDEENLLAELDTLAEHLRDNGALLF